MCSSSFSFIFRREYAGKATLDWENSGLQAQVVENANHESSLKKETEQQYESGIENSCLKIPYYFQKAIGAQEMIPKKI